MKTLLKIMSFVIISFISLAAQAEDSAAPNTPTTATVAPKATGTMQETSLSEAQNLKEETTPPPAEGPLPQDQIKAL